MGAARTAEAGPRVRGAIWYLRKFAQEAAALVIGLGVWTGLSLLIVEFAWRFESVWWFVLLPAYLPAPVAAFVYALLIRPRTAGARPKRGLVFAVFGWLLSSPLPLYPLFNQIERVFVHFHPIPTGGDDYGLGVWLGSLLSYWLIGIWFCPYSGYWAGRLVDVLLRTAPRRVDRPAPPLPW